MVFFVEIIGSVAALLTTISFLPQVFKTYKEKSVDNLSLVMLVTMFLGVFLWLVYGVYKDSFPIIIANVITLFSTGLLLYFKINYTKKS